VKVAKYSFLPLIAAGLILTGSCTTSTPASQTPFLVSSPSSTMPAASATVVALNSSPLPLSTALPTAPAVSELDTSKLIAYSDQSTGNIYTISAGGGITTQLTHVAPPDNCAYPNWAPDGNSLAFMCNSAQGPDIYVSDENGENLRPLIDTELFETRPVWSPDGQMIAYTIYPDYQSWELHVMSVVDRKAWRVVGGTADKSGFIDTQYCWSSDNKSLVYYDVASDEIYAVKADGSGKEVVPQSSNAGNREPDCSSHRRDLVYMRGGSIMMANLDESSERLLLSGPSIYSPIWSPDGREVVATDFSDRGGIVLLSPENGTSWRRLDGQSVLDKAWAPDSSHIAYIGNDDNQGHFSLYILDVFTGATNRLVALEPETFSWIDWQP